MKFPTREELRVLAREYVIKYGSVTRAVEELGTLQCFANIPLHPTTTCEDGKIDIIAVTRSESNLNEAIRYISGEVVSDGFSDYSDDSVTSFADPDKALSCIRDSLANASGCHEALESMYWDQLLTILKEQPSLTDRLGMLFDCAIKIMSYDQAFQIGEMILTRFIRDGVDGELAARVVSSLARATVFVRKDLLASFAKILKSSRDLPLLKKSVAAWMSRKSAADALNSS